MVYETQSSLQAAFPFGGHSLHECYITERNWPHINIRIDSVLLEHHFDFGNHV